MKKLFTFILEIAIFTNLFSGCSADAQTPEKVVENFKNEYFNRNINEASKYLTKEMREEFIKDNLRWDDDGLRFFSELSKMETEILRTNNVPSDTEEVICYFLNENKVKVYRWRVYLKKNENTWEITDFGKISKI
ncbi:MAG: hypothetical protein PHP83_03020 [Clostridia bacterium]|nr:hypothetical protein [Clostridia bacterium]